MGPAFLPVSLRRKKNFSYDALGRRVGLTRPNGVNMAYNYDNLSIYKSGASGTMIYVYDGDNIEEEVNATGALQERWTYGPGVDEPLVGQRQPKVFYYEADGIGSVTSLTDATGAVAATYAYDSFGNMTASTGSATNSFRYAGREFDDSTALYYNRARYYDQTTGRFLSEDPLGSFDGDVNFYPYVRNNPAAFTDPTGLSPEPAACKPQSRGLRAPTQQEYDACMQKAASGRDDAILEGRIEQVAGGAAILGGIVATAPVISLNQVFFNSGAEGFVNFLHVGGFVYVGNAAAFIPGYLYFKGTFSDIPKAWNQYYARSISCAAPVSQ